jgi:3-oxoacyl-[acyl-carrier protein] reductase
VLLGSTSGEVSETLLKIIGAAGADAQTTPSEGARWGALVLDARSVAAPSDLGNLRAFLTPQLRSLLPTGRVLVLGRTPDGNDIAVDATRQALDGIVRSLAKELQRGATANLLWVEDEASLESAIRFFLSGRSAYVDGQPVLLAAGSAPAPADWAHPLAGKTALVTGAARGIGAAIAGVLARDGAHVIAADLPQAGEALAKVANRIGGSTLQLDISAPDAPDRLLAHLAGQTGGLDILIHNAGITRDKLLANMKPEQWDAVLAVNLESQLRINAALLGSDQLNPQARVVTLSSTTGLAGNRGQTNYGATKAAVIGMVRSSAAAFAKHGDSTINAVAPGFIDTDMTAKMPLATREVARRLSSLQQAGLPIDVAEAVAWLASPGAGGINGQVLRVCGQNLVGA